jgi:hypothetical protein
MPNSASLACRLQLREGVSLRQKVLSYGQMSQVPCEQIVDYKGVQGIKKYLPYSEYSTMRFGNGHSQYWHAATMKHLRSHLDMSLEASLGYFYTDIFNRCAPSPAVSKIALSAPQGEVSGYVLHIHGINLAGHTSSVNLALQTSQTSSCAGGCWIRRRPGSSRCQGRFTGATRTRT